MKRRQAEPLPVLDDHHRGVRNINAHFNDGRGNEHIDIARSERIDDLLFAASGHMAMEHLHTHIWQQPSHVLAFGLNIMQRHCLTGAPVFIDLKSGHVLEFISTLLRRHHRTDHIRLPAPRKAVAERAVRKIAAGALQHLRGYACPRDGRCLMTLVSKSPYTESARYGE